MSCVCVCVCVCIHQVDTFLLKKHKNLGELVKVKIGHDNSGMGPGA